VSELKVDLTGARIFKEWPRETSARWYVLPNGDVLHARAPGHLIPSVHDLRGLLSHPSLVEVTP
jgi:hypothetical protein